MPEGKIYQAIVSVMREIGAIGKDSRNESQKFNYRAAEQVYNRVQPLFARHGIFSTPKVIEQKREVGETKSGGTMHYSILTVEYTFFAEDGSSITTTVVGEGMDSGDKASNKAMTSAHKYAICQILNIGFQVIDPDQFTPEWFSSKPKPVTLDDLNKLKVAWLEANKSSLNSQDKAAIKLAFSQWVNEMVGEPVKADDFRDWTPEQLETCREALGG
jgi:hypothetical protein